MLYRIRDYFGVGHVESRNEHCTFVIRKTKDIITILIPFLNKNKLRTTKYLDFIDFSTVAYLIKDRSSTKNIDITQIILIYNRINSKRIISKNNISIITSQRIEMNISWLIGFIEGEGTFGFKSLSPYFQFGQHKRNIYVIKDISNYLESLTSLFSYSSNCRPMKISFTINKLTNVVVISNSNVDCLHDIFVHNFLPFSFQTRKAVDFHY